MRAMLKPLTSVLLGACAALSLATAALPSRAAEDADDILAVLQRSQQLQLDALSEAEVDAASPEAQTVRKSFEQVQDLLGLGEVRLLVMRGPLLAVCLMGRVVAANASLAAMSESERRFILAHELGHAAQGHWAELGALYKKHIPGAVRREQTDAIAGELGRDASELSHRHEYEADAFALQVIRRMGEPDDTPVLVFQHLPLVKPTATHPGTSQRVAHLRGL